MSSESLAGERVEPEGEEGGQAAAEQQEIPHGYSSSCRNDVRSLRKKTRGIGSRDSRWIAGGRDKDGAKTRWS
jgi:hypothetical protein